MNIMYYMHTYYFMHLCACVDMCQPDLFLGERGDSWQCGNSSVLQTSSKPTDCSYCMGVYVPQVDQC